MERVMRYIFILLTCLIFNFSCDSPQKKSVNIKQLQADYLIQLSEFILENSSKIPEGEIIVYPGLDCKACKWIDLNDINGSKKLTILHSTEMFCIYEGIEDVNCLHYDPNVFQKMNLNKTYVSSYFFADKKLKFIKAYIQ